MFRLPRQESYWSRDGHRRQFSVYILSNTSMRLYVGVTNDLRRRVAQHRSGEVEFTAKYHFDRVVYFETYELVTQAIHREKQLKGWTRAKKIALVRSMNPSWSDLSLSLTSP